MKMLRVVLLYKQRLGLCGYGYAIVLALALMGLVACVPQPGPPNTASIMPISPELSSPTTSLLPQNWQTRWLKGIPCRPPCCEGLKPGQTTVEEAVEILHHNPLVTTVEVTAVPLLPTRGVVSWRWANTGKEGVASFHAGTPPSPIYAVYPSYPNISFRLGDVIQAYGEPSHIMADSYYSPDGNDVLYDFRILYLSQGFVLEGYGGFAKPSLSADTSFEHVWFFVPGEDGLLAALDGGWATFSDMFVPWQGMRDFDYYCRDERGNPCP